MSFWALPVAQARIEPVQIDQVLIGLAPIGRTGPSALPDVVLAGLSVL